MLLCSVFCNFRESLAILASMGWFFTKFKMNIAFRCFMFAVFVHIIVHCYTMYFELTLQNHCLHFYKFNNPFNSVLKFKNLLYVLTVLFKFKTLDNIMSHFSLNIKIKLKINKNCKSFHFLF